MARSWHALKIAHAAVEAATVEVRSRVQMNGEDVRRGR